MPRCVSLTVVEYLLDSRERIYRLLPPLALAFEVLVPLCLALFFYVALGDPGQIKPPTGRNALDSYLGAALGPKGLS